VPKIAFAEAGVIKNDHFEPCSLSSNLTSEYTSRSQMAQRCAVAVFAFWLVGP
jgi:hypothetical protein